MARPRYKKADQLRAEVRELMLRRGASDSEVLNGLEELSLGEPAFFMTAPEWAPELYRRNRVVFGPFIQSHLLRAGFDGRRWRMLSWKQVADTFDPWLKAVESDDDDPRLFATLFSWKHPKIKAAELVDKYLLPELEAADSPSKKQHVLRKYDRYFALTEDAALRLYEAAPEASRQYILLRIPTSWSTLKQSEKRKPWRQLLAKLSDSGDEEFHLDLYRRQIPVEDWEQDVLALAQEETSDADLVLNLERHHPISYGLRLAPTYIRLLKARGRGVLPYVYRHLRELRGFFAMTKNNDVKDMEAFALEQGWYELWTAVIRICGQAKDFNRALESVMLEPTLDDEQTAQRLRLLAGASRELSFGGLGLAFLHRLDDGQALRIYEAFPSLLQGPFKANLRWAWRSNGYPTLLKAAVDRRDDDLVDYLASRVVTQISPEATQVALYVDVYQALDRDDAGFAQRAASVLGRVPAYTIFDYEQLVQRNRLARLLYQRSAGRYVAAPTAVQDLLESPEIHAQILALKAITSAAGATEKLAEKNLGLLLPMLLRPLHRASRSLAFAALEGAATDPTRAQHIVDKCRAALDLPDRRYPKDELVALIGRLLAQHEGLRSPSEQPKIYRRGAA